MKKKPTIEQLWQPIVAEIGRLWMGGHRDANGIMGQSILMLGQLDGTIGCHRLQGFTKNSPEYLRALEDLAATDWIEEARVGFGDRGQTIKVAVSSGETWRMLKSKTAGKTLTEIDTACRRRRAALFWKEECDVARERFIAGWRNIVGGAVLDAIDSQNTDFFTDCARYLKKASKSNPSPAGASVRWKIDLLCYLFGRDAVLKGRKKIRIVDLCDELRRKNHFVSRKAVQDQVAAWEKDGVLPAVRHKAGGRR